MGMRMIPFLYRVGSGASGDKKRIFGTLFILRNEESYFGR